DDELEIDRAFGELFQENAWRWIRQDVRVTFSGGDQRLAYLIHVAAISDPNWNPEPDPRVKISPVRHRRIDELRIRHDHRDVVVGHNHGAARPNLLDLPDDACHLHPIADGDRSLGENHQPADEITRNVLEPEPDADADRAGENGERT